MWPLPPAIKEPARPKILACSAHSSVPVMERAYCPTKVALETYAPGGGGGGRSEIYPPPPPPAAKNVTKSQASGAIRFTRVFITEANPVAHFACSQLAARREPRD